MSQQKDGSHTRLFDFYVLFRTKGRQKFSDFDTNEILSNAIEEIANNDTIKVLDGFIEHDHLYLILSISPCIDINRLVEVIKRQTAQSIRYGDRLWEKGYFCCNAKEVTPKMIKNYLESPWPGIDDEEHTVEG
ncbi:MAG: transposase [Deltaproteobacteria bacterium]|jgi:REP element-mobilizing transposase RayT|nr:transposase [Deltaproteobacteria bacterium]